MFVTTFKTVSEDDKTVIKSENKKFSQKDNVVVEEVLSEDEAVLSEEKASSDVQIEEVFDDGKLNNTLLPNVLHLTGYKIMSI